MGESVRVMALHALVYCQRLFYLEEVEEIRVADEAVWAGRRLHVELDEPEEVVSLTLESEVLGIRGRVDAIRRREGNLYPVEHKRGRSRQGLDGAPDAWPADRIQAVAYSCLLEEHTGEAVPEARIRYHADGKTVRIPVDTAARADLRASVDRARALRATIERPPVTEHARKCIRCSLAPVCLPEESRFATARAVEAAGQAPVTPVRLFPPDRERRSLHITRQAGKVGRSADTLIYTDDEGWKQNVPIREVSDVVLHGHAQITTQALRLCAANGVPVHLLTQSGSYLGGFSAYEGATQRKLRQYEGLREPATCLALARRLVDAKVLLQLHHLLRASRGSAQRRETIKAPLISLRAALRGIAHADDREALIGYEGQAAKSYFAAMPSLISPEIDGDLRPEGRSRRPPRDRFNALLSMGYSLLYRDMLSAIIRVGLEPAVGILHQPRSAALPLALDVMELFRVLVVDMAVVAAVNRRTFDVNADFAVTADQVWLSDAGRRKLIGVYARRKHEEHRHPALDYSISYARMMELEVRLLEKEWSGEAGCFARFRLR